MDELELLTAMRPEVAPPPDSVTRDRARLRAAISTAGEGDVAGGGAALRERGGPEPLVVHLAAGAATGAGRRRMGRRAVLGAAASVVLLAGLAVAAQRTGGSGDPPVAAASDRADTVESEAGPAPGAPGDGGASEGSEPTCGAELPGEVPTPAGYEGPIEGPSPDAPAPPNAGQLVRHWAGSTGTVELRWPADRRWSRLFTVAITDKGVAEEHGTDSVGLASIVGEPQRAPSGRLVIEVGMSTRDLEAGMCATFQLMVADRDLTHARQVGSEVYSGLTEPGALFGGPVVPLVTDWTSADAPPHIPPCPGFEDAPYSPYQGGPVADVGSYPRPAEALEAFIATQTGTWTDQFGVEVSQALVAENDYTETTLPDGSIAYAHRQEAGVTVVHTVRTAAGWTVDRWDATGC